MILRKEGRKEEKREGEQIDLWRLPSSPSSFSFPFHCIVCSCVCVYILEEKMKKILQEVGKEGEEGQARGGIRKDKGDGLMALGIYWYARLQEKIRLVCNCLSHIEFCTGLKCPLFAEVSTLNL